MRWGDRLRELGVGMAIKHTELCVSMDDTQRAQALGVIVMCVAVLGLRLTAMLVIATGVLAQRKPSITSFLVFFEAWFKLQFVPQMSTRLTQELAVRAQTTTSLFDAVKDSFRVWMVENSKGLQAAVLWDTVTRKSLPTMRMYDLGVMRVAVINLGSAEQPMQVSFWGMWDTWFLSPLIKLDFDNVSVLEAMQTQVG
jgi:hypothetical protein